MHDFSSYVEVRGEVMRVTPMPGYTLVRVFFRDKQSPAKFVNVFAWNGTRAVIDQLNLEKGDQVLVKGELAWYEHSKGDSHGIYLESIEKVEKIEKGMDF